MLIDKILSLENKELLNYKFSKYNLLIWPFIRAYLIEHIYLKETKSDKPSERRGKLDLFKNISYMLKTIKYNPFNYANYKIVFLITQIATTFKIEGKYVNRLHDYFALEYPESTLIVEKSERRAYKLPRYFKNVALEDYMYIYPYLKSLTKKIDKRDLYNIEAFIEYAGKIFNNYLDYKDLKIIYNRLLTEAVYAPLFYENYIKLFKKLKPSVILIYAASGGKRKTSIVKAAKDLSIKSCEFQHGIISHSHPFYNYSEDLFYSSEYREYLPNYLLTWGEFWNNNMRHPAEKITVGYPYVIKRLEEYRKIKKQNNKKRVVLIVSQGTITKIFVNIVKKLLMKLDVSQHNIMFKLHPGEVPFKERYSELYKYKGVEIVKSGDIYDMIFKSDIVVACYSTVVFEVLAFKKPLFILNNRWSQEYIPKTIGNWFETADELYKLITSGKIDSKEVNNNIEYYWEPNWQKNYKRFVEDVVGIKTNRRQLSEKLA
ncbi:MAG: CDP-glycerol glycerophosphotransferase family protein [Deferribacterota bacterium]|nr:CDP-glycerol glycerophosphotransferase family protein [Deferribacterota bacterium]